MAAETMGDNEARSLIMDMSPYRGRIGEWRFWRQFLVWESDRYTGKWPVVAPFTTAHLHEFLAENGRQLPEVTE